MTVNNVHKISARNPLLINLFKFTEDIKRFYHSYYCEYSFYESFDNESKENGKDMENKMEGKFPPRVGLYSAGLASH